MVHAFLRSIKVSRILLAALLMEPLTLVLAAQSADVTCSSGRFHIEDISSSNLNITENLSDIHPQLIVERGNNPSSIEIILNGPVLESMDSSDVGTHLACTSDGVKILATVVRSADYQGAVLANYIWRPIIKVTADLYKAEIVVVSTWRMRLTTGASVKIADTPPNLHQDYPVTIKKKYYFQQ